MDIINEINNILAIDNVKIIFYFHLLRYFQ